jgi:hypothetical protein
MVAGPTGQVGIIRRARESGSAQRIRYSVVRQELRAYLLDLGRSSAKLAAIHNRMAQRSENPALSNWEREDARLSLDVLNAFAGMENKIAGARFESPPRNQPLLPVGGVDVSVQVDAMMVRSRGDKDEIGGVLFRMTKADDGDGAQAKRHEMGQYAATLAFMQVQTNLARGLTPHHQLCASFDIQAGEVHYAPRTYMQRSQSLENACWFIAALWNDA